MKTTESLSISISSTILQALKKMDDCDVKLLIVVNHQQEYVGLLSMGDIQRYFLKNQDFGVSISQAMRDNYIVAHVGDTLEKLREIIFKHRMVYMPLIDDNNQVAKLIFWEDLFEAKKETLKNPLDLPVVVMAGGSGTRLRPLTHIIPKPLIPLGDRPILQVILDKFVDVGCSEFFCSVNYKADMVEDFFKDKDEYSISFFREPKPLGTAGSLSMIKNKISTPFFVSNCDIIINDDYHNIYKTHLRQNNELTAVAFIKEVEIPYGTMDVNDSGYLQKLIEKPKFTYLVNAGMYLLNPDLLEEIPENEFFHITHLMEKICNRGGKVGVFPISNGSWHDIGQWEEYQKTLLQFGYTFGKTPLN